MNDTATFNGEPYDPYTEQPWLTQDGVVRQYEGGTLWYEIPYVNGQLHGIEKWYHQDGSLQGEIPWVNGQRHGIVKWYYQDGILEEQIPWVNEVEGGPMHDPITAAKLEEVRQSEAAMEAAKREREYKCECTKNREHHEKYFPWMYTIESKPKISDR